MSKASEAIQRRFGANLNESLGVRNVSGGELPPLPATPPRGFPRENGPDDGRTRARDAGHMEVSRIVADPDQPRKEFDDDAIDRLAASLLKHGQLMPIRVRWNATLSKWVVISGERRFRAASRAGLKTVACIFAEDGLTTSEILQEQIIENLLRENLKPVEQARAYRQLMDLHGWTAKELAAELQVSQGAISKSLSLLALPEEIQAEVDAGAIAPTTAYEVAKIPDPTQQRDLAQRIIDEKLTRDVATEAVRAAVAQPTRVRSPRPKAHHHRPKTHTFQTAAGVVSVTLPIVSESNPVQDIIQALEEALSQARIRPESSL